MDDLVGQLDWQIENLDESPVEIGAFVRHSCEILAKSRNSGISTRVRAACTDREDTKKRAMFRLLERICILNLGNISTAAEHLNGIALHFDLNTARAAAKKEIIERDCILRSWFGHSHPIKVHPQNSYKNAALEKFYKFETYYVEDFSGAVIALFFGFPKDANSQPLFYGFGSGAYRTAAIRKAVDDACQRLAFLWKEAPLVMESKNTSEEFFQREIFLFQASAEQLQNWLRGDNPKEAYPDPVLAENIVYSDLTPALMKGRFHIIKASSERRMLKAAEHKLKSNGECTSRDFGNPEALALCF